MRRTARRVFSLLAVSAVFSGGFAIAQGCGSDSFTASPSTDGGGDGSVAADAGPQDSGPVVVVDACVKPPSVDSAQQAFCDAFAEISTRCLDCKQCRQDNANACQAFGASLSDAFRNGIVACKDQIECSEFEDQQDLPGNPCVAAFIVDGGATNTQKNAAVAYCTSCPDSGVASAGCQNYFFDGDAGGIGSITLVSSDAVTNTIIKDCSAVCDPGSYVVCTLAFGFCPAAGKDECGTGLCK